MTSIGECLSAKDLMAQIRMERQKDQSNFMLMEGSSDIKRVSKFFDLRNCSMVNCFGKDNVFDVLEMALDIGQEDCLGFIDSDFDRLLDPVASEDEENLIISDTHDFDLDFCLTPVVERYLGEVAETRKLNRFGGCNDYIHHLLEILRPLSAMRYANERHDLRYNFQRIRMEDFFDGREINIEQMVLSVSKGAFASDENKLALREHIDNYITANLDLRQLTNGHDFCTALGIALRSSIGDRKGPQTFQSEIEMHFRLALDLSDLAETSFLKKIEGWQIEQDQTILVE